MSEQLLNRTASQHQVIADGLHWNAVAPRNLREREGFACVLMAAIVATVVLLGGLGGPSAVFWGVVAVSVLAVERKCVVRPVSHVGQERLKGIPAFADLDAAPAVVPIFTNAGVVAATAHSGPNSVFSRSGQSVRSFLVGRPFAAVATARFRQTVRNATYWDHCTSAAVAQAPPVFGKCRSVVGSPRNTKDGQSSESGLVHSNL